MNPPPPADVTDAVPPTSSPVPTTPPAATWPKWTGPVDRLLAVLVLVVAFLATSVTARNHDMWPHFAAGRALLNGSYWFGTDPFSFVDRTWVNHSWLYDVASYLLMNTDPSGGFVVGLKALLFAAAFAVGLFHRKSDHPLWPWVLVSLLGILAAIPHGAGLRPIVVSALFLSITLYLLLARDWTGRGAMYRIVLGVLAWVWASTDTLFLLGPLTVALVLLGEWLQTRVLKSVDETRGVSLRDLVLTLGVMVMASSLTPHHVRVWQLPLELGLGLSPDLTKDGELAIVHLSPLFDGRFINMKGLGNNLNGYAFGLLILVGAFSLSAGFGRVRVAHVLVWTAYAVLALVHYQWILLFAVAAVPVAGLALSGMAGRVSLGARSDPQSAALLLLSGVGRLLAVPTMLGLVVATYPGWLHPQPTTTATVARLNWAVQSDAGTQRTAELLHDWHTSGKLPAEYRGFILNPGLANHLAWFAPGLKVFVNGRFQHHRPELEDLFRTRRTLLNRGGPQIEPRELDELGERMATHRLSYLAYTGTATQQVDIQPVVDLTARPERYALWHIDGRAVILGDLQAPQADPSANARLAFQPARLAFQPDVTETPVEVSPPAPPRTTAEWYIEPFINDPPKPIPTEAFDAFVYARLALAAGSQDRYNRIGFQGGLAGVLGNPHVAVTAFSQAYLTPHSRAYLPADHVLAYNILASRAAHRAIALNPEPEVAYLALVFLHGQNGDLPVIEESLRQKQYAAAIRQYLDRAKPRSDMPPRAALETFQLAGQLADYYIRDLGCPELAFRTVDKAKIYYDLSNAADSTEDRGKKMKQLNEQITQLEKQTAAANDEYERQLATGKLNLAQQIMMAVNFRLFGRAADRFPAWQEEFRASAAKNQIDPTAPMVLVAMAEMYLNTGQTEPVADILDTVQQLLEQSQKAAANPQQFGPAFAKLQQQRALLWLLTGNYSAYGEWMEESRLPPFTDEAKRIVAAAAAVPTDNDFQQHMTAGPMVVGGCLFGFAGVPDLNRQVVNQWFQRSNFFLSRGIIHLLEGKPADAERRFRQALAPEGVALPAFVEERAILEHYVKVLERAKTAAK